MVHELGKVVRRYAKAAAAAKKNISGTVIMVNLVVKSLRAAYRSWGHGTAHHGEKNIFWKWVIRVDGDDNDADALQFRFAQSC